MKCIPSGPLKTISNIPTNYQGFGGSKGFLGKYPETHFTPVNSSISFLPLSHDDPLASPRMINQVEFHSTVMDSLIELFEIQE